jgi:hypothetical protein
MHPVPMGWLSARGWYWQNGPGRMKLGDKLLPRRAMDIFGGYTLTGEHRVFPAGHRPRAYAGQAACGYCDGFGWVLTRGQQEQAGRRMITVAETPCLSCDGTGDGEAYRRNAAARKKYAAEVHAREMAERRERERVSRRIDAQNRANRCRTCKGLGQILIVASAKYVTCRRCNGSGQRRVFY